MQGKRGFCLLLTTMLLSATLGFAGGGQEEAAPQQAAEAGQDESATAQMGEFEQKWRDPDIPESWYSEPRKASEVGITSFNQSPMLDERVANGELPPVEERLPNDPPVVEPYDEVGDYGGRMVMYGVDLASEFLYHAGGDFGREGLNIATPDGQTYVPWMADDIKYLDNDTVIEITFREGLKWSDGTPFVAGEEYEFYWNHTLNKAEVDPSLHSPPLEDIVAVDDNTVRIKLGESFPSYPYHLQNTWIHDTIGESAPLAPMHIIKQYLPEFVGEEEALKRAKELGFDDVTPLIAELGAQVREQSNPRFGVPTTDAYVVVSRTESEVVLERNPYYPFVDTEGNQLPYIDRIIIRFAAQRDNVELQAIAGDSDVLLGSAQIQRIPVYIENEDDGDYETYIYQNAAISKPFYIFNFTPPDESGEYGSYYQNDKFRKAMSLAINREEVNERFYFGEGIPMQATVSPMSDHFKPEYGNSYADYDPERARRLLEDIGLVDSDGDGFRNFPDGDAFIVKMMYAQEPYLSDVELHEYILTNWADVGIQVDIQTVNGSVFWERSGAGQWDMKMHILDFSIPYPIGFVMWSTPHEPPEVHPFGQWSTWLRTGGSKGVRPPQSVRDELAKLYEAAGEYLNTLSDEALNTILESQAENIWVIGTVGFPPKPFLVSNRIKNVPEKLLFDGIIGGERIAYPVQWYIDE